MLETRDRKRFYLLALVYSVIILSAVTYAFVARRSHLHHVVRASGLATVNGRTIFPQEFFTALRAAHGREVFNHLLQRAAILQEADQEKLTLTSSELAPELEKIDKHNPDAELRRYFEQEARAHLLLRKLVLRTITEAQKQHVYETFRAALEQYEISLLTVNSSAQADQVASALANGKSLSSLAEGPNKIPGTSYSSGLVTRAELAAAFDPLHGEAVTDLKFGDFLRFTRQNQVIFVQVLSVRDSYEALKPSVEQVLVESARDNYQYDLMRRANVSVPTAAPLAGSPDHR